MRIFLEKLMKITIEIESLDELSKLKQWLNLIQDQSNHDLIRPIEDLEFTVRTNNCLRADGIITIEDLLKWSDIELLKTPHIGRKSLAEIKDKLALKGLSLKPHNAELTGVAKRSPS